MERVKYISLKGSVTHGIFALVILGKDVVMLHRSVYIVICAWKNCILTKSDFGDQLHRFYYNRSYWQIFENESNVVVVSFRR